MLTSHRCARRFLAALILVPVVGGIQTVNAQSGVAVGRDASSLTPGSWNYRMTMQRDGDSVPMGERTLQISAATVGGQAVWRLVDVVMAGGREISDTLFVTRDSLRPISRVAHMGPVTIRNSFSRDSVTGSITAGGTTHPVAIASQRGLVVNGGMLEAALTLAPIANGWTATVPHLVPAPTGVSVVPVTLRVRGQESVTVPAGTFSAWVLEAEADGVRQTIWLASDSRRLLKIRAELPQLQNAVHETVLEGSPR